MAFFTRNKISLLIVFYKSTLPLSTAISALCAVLAIFNIPMMLMSFGICLMSGGSIATLAYLEWTKKQEYYFYHNRGLGKLPLVLTCVSGNIILGAFIVFLAILCGAR